MLFVMFVLMQVFFDVSGGLRGEGFRLVEPCGDFTSIEAYDIAVVRVLSVPEQAVEEPSHLLGHASGVYPVHVEERPNAVVSSRGMPVEQMQRRNTLVLNRLPEN